MKMKTIVTALLVCALAATALTGCGEKEPNYNDFSRNFATTILNPASYGDNLDELYKTEALKNFFAETVHEESVTEVLRIYGERFTAMASPTVDVKSVETQNASKEKDGQYSLDIVMKYSIKEGDKTTDLTDTISAVLMMDGTEWKIVSLTPTNMGIEDMTLEKENA